MNDFKFDYHGIFTELTYLKPLKVRSQTITFNHFLKIEFEQSALFISTLHHLNPHFHQKSLIEINHVLNDFFSTYSLCFDQVVFDQPFFNTITTPINLVENRFFESEFLYHIEVTLLFLLQKKCPNLFSNTTAIKINELASSHENFEKYIATECLKFKFSPDSQIKDLEFIHSLVRKNPQCLWRFDGNRQWDLIPLIEFCESLPKDINIDYFEEPLKVFSDVYLFEKRYSYPMAIDESFEAFIQKTTSYHFPIVAKASLFGVSPIYKWIKQHPQTKIIISSSYEHPSAMIGLDLLARLKPLEYHGLPKVF